MGNQQNIPAVHIKYFLSTYRSIAPRVCNSSWPSHDPSLAKFPWYTFTSLYILCLPAGCTCIPSRDPLVQQRRVCVCYFFTIFSLFAARRVSQGYSILHILVDFTIHTRPVVHSIMDPSQRECVHIDILKYCLFVEVASGGRVYELVHVRTSIQIAVQRCRT